MTIFPVAARGRSARTTSCSGIFCVISFASRQYATISSKVSGLGALGGLDDRADPLAAFGVGEADDRDVLDLRVRVEQVLDLLGADVLALADDDVLEPAGEHDVPVVADVAQVAGPEEAVGVERVAVSSGSV